MYSELKNPIFEMETKGERAPLAATTFFGVFAAIGFLMPLVIIGIMVNSGDGLKLGYLISSAVFVAVGYYFFRLVSWNLNGKEIIEVFDDEVVYRAKTKLLTLQTHRLDLIGCVLFQSNIENGKADYLLRNNEQVVGMVFRANTLELDQLETVLDQRN